MSAVEPVRPQRDEPSMFLGDLGPTIYELKCDDCGAVIAALDMGPVVPLRDALEERLIAEHVCVT